VKGGPSVWKLDDAEELKKQREEKDKKTNEQALKKLEGQLNQRQKDLAKWKEKAKAPKDVFAERKSEFSAFDEKGFPTKDNKNEDLAPSKIKKIQAQWKKQEKDYNDVQAALAKDPSFLSKLEEEVENLKQQLGSNK